MSPSPREGRAGGGSGRGESEPHLPMQPKHIRCLTADSQCSGDTTPEDWGTQFASANVARLNKLSFVIRVRHLFLPKPFRCSMVLEYLFLLARIVELDLAHALAHPVEKELG